MNDGAKSQKATVAPDDVRRGQNKQSIVDISWVYAAVPNPCCPCWVIFILGYVFFASPRPLCASLKSSTTPEVHNLSQRRQKTTELYSQKSVKIEHVVPGIIRGQTNTCTYTYKQTNRHARLITIPRSPTGGGIMSFSFCLKVFSDSCWHFSPGRRAPANTRMPCFLNLILKLTLCRTDSQWRPYGSGIIIVAAVFYCDVFVYIKYYKNKFNWQ